MKLAHQVVPSPVDEHDAVIKQYTDGLSGSDIEILNISNRESYDDDTPLVVGAIVFDPLAHEQDGMTAAYAFRAIVAMGDVGVNGWVRLWNATNSQMVAASPFSSNNTTKHDVVLARGSGFGQIHDGEHLYEVHILLAAPSGGPTHTIELYGAELRIVQTAV